MSNTSPETLKRTADTLRGLAMDAVQRANSGHPGMPMGTADLAAVLWLEHLRFLPDDPEWAGRDRFVLSAGHGSMLLYGLLHLAGYDLPMAELERFRQLHSKTPGHPEFGETPGVETTTGPLGQGFATGVGMALAARMEAARFRCPELCTRVFGIVSDGDLMEGISAEAASLAGHLGLANLVYLYDDNRITIDGETDLTFSEDVEQRFAAQRWHVLRCEGHDFDAVRRTLDAAVGEAERPTLVICRTHIAKGSPNKVDTSASHGAPLGDEEIALTKRALGLPEEAFHVPPEVRAAFAARAEANRRARAQWEDAVARWRSANATLATAHQSYRARRTPADLADQLRTAIGDDTAATRVLSGVALQTAARLVPSVVGGSADLEGSCNTRLKDSPAVRRDDLSGRNIHFGIREHAMAAICNGMALQGGALPLCSTFLTFSDYMRPSIRLAALMRLPTAFVFTHDSLLLGEDGPTHQPVEHLAALRLIPGLHVFRPADGFEVAAAWTHALERRDGPVALALTRQKVPALARDRDLTVRDVLRGGYTLRAAADPQAVLIATGAEVALALAAAEELDQRGINARVVSMPCVELFRLQSDDYRAAVLPPGTATFAVEMGRREGWCEFTGRLEHVIGVDGFGASAPAADLAEHFGFTAPRVAEHVEGVLARVPAG